MCVYPSAYSSRSVTSQVCTQELFVQAWLSHAKKESDAKKVLPLSFFSFSSLLMYLCSMVWLNHLRTRYNKPKFILIGSLNSHLCNLSAKITYFCK